MQNYCLLPPNLHPYAKFYIHVDLVKHDKTEEVWIQAVFRFTIQKD